MLSLYCWSRPCINNTYVHVWALPRQWQSQRGDSTACLTVCLRISHCFTWVYSSNALLFHKVNPFFAPLSHLSFVKQSAVMRLGFTSEMLFVQQGYSQASLSLCFVCLFLLSEIPWDTGIEKELPCEIAFFSVTEQLYCSYCTVSIKCLGTTM